jgi:hypothetical protein
VRLDHVIIEPRQVRLNALRRLVRGGAVKREAFEELEQRGADAVESGGAVHATCDFVPQLGKPTKQFPGRAATGSNA